ncbi:hypothetical protein DPMN_008312 [Dreissena polymorpha]|uniref:Uncharacterized protein n=1 Tax=Dreissena polymorpha TaxID=45954 RepID=A0A9D4MXU4_DREPO|nr:hypothetical protein DPMN_008312 [Dreissena polymorpha]
MRVITSFGNKFRVITSFCKQLRVNTSFCNERMLINSFGNELRVIRIDVIICEHAYNRIRRDLLMKDVCRNSSSKMPSIRRYLSSLTPRS